MKGGSWHLKMVTADSSFKATYANTFTKYLNDKFQMKYKYRSYEIRNGSIIIYDRINMPPFI